MNNNTFINDDETLCLRISGNEIKIPKQSKSYYLLLQKLTNVIYQSKSKSFFFVLPGNISEEDFNLYLNFITSSIGGEKQITTSSQLFQVFKVAKELNDYNLILSSIKEDVMNLLNNNNTSSLIHDELKIMKWCINEINSISSIKELKGNSDESNTNFKELYLSSLELCIENCTLSLINKLKNNFVDDSNIKTNENCLLSYAKVLPKIYIRQIISKAMKEFYTNVIVFNNSINKFIITPKQKQLLEMFIKIYMKSIDLNLNTQIFECLNLENIKAHKEFDNNIKKAKIKPIQWNINNISLYNDNSYESEIFPLCDSISFKLLAHYNKEEDTLSIAMEIIPIKKINEDYFVTFLTKIKSNNKEYQTKLHCVYVNNSSKALIITFHNFSKGSFENEVDPNQTIQTENVTYMIECFTEVNYIFGGIVYYIVSNFSTYYKHSDDIGIISFNCLKMILKHKLIHQHNEDMAMIVILRWLSSTKAKVRNEDVEVLLNFVNLNEITLDCLIEIIFKFNKILDKYYDSIGEAIQMEFHERMVLNYNYNDNFDDSSNSAFDFTKELINKLILNNNNTNINNNISVNVSEPLTNAVTPLTTLLSYKSSKEKSISLEHKQKSLHIKHKTNHSVKTNDRKRRLSTFNHSTTNNTSHNNNNQNNVSSNNNSLINSRNNCNFLTKNNTNVIVPSPSNISAISFGHKKNKSVNLDGTSKLKLNPIDCKKDVSKLRFQIELKKRLRDEKMKKKFPHQTFGETNNYELIKHSSKYTKKEDKGRNKFNKVISKTRQPSRIVSPTLSYNKNNNIINSNTTNAHKNLVYTLSGKNNVSSKKGPIKAKK